MTTDQPGIPTISDTCTACAQCCWVCPARAITLSRGARISHDLCTGCLRCVLACPVGAIRAPGGGLSPAEETATDIVVVGAGLGGMLAATALALTGARVMVLEAQSAVGGRFTTIPTNGYQASTGALHLVPHGANGPFARLARDLGVPVEIRDPGLLAALRRDGHEHRARHLGWPSGYFGVLGQFRFLRVLAAARAAPTLADTVTFGEWLRGMRVTEGQLAFWAAFTRFALSATPEELSYSAARALLGRIAHLGGPGILVGGCGGFMAAIEARAREAGVELRCAHRVTALAADGSGVAALVEDRQRARRMRVLARAAVMDTGYEEARELLGVPGERRPRASGLKLQILTPESPLDHAGVLLCPQAHRVGGVVQISNALPELSQAGMNLLIAHQVMLSDDAVREAEAGLMEVAELLGGAVVDRAERVDASAYSGAWPVNRARQGCDYGPRLPARGVYSVGDSCKPTGYAMAEGVAASVEACLRAMTEDGVGVTSSADHAVTAPYAKG